MEQSRVYGKSQWYHETQSRHQNADVLPLVPEAAHVSDRFLLDLQLSAPVSEQCAGWLNLSSRIAEHLFPAAVTNTRLNTFSIYERISTALTVAQVTGVQRLCNHYAARLAPLPGPDSSRESNHRLAQITQYARQLAGSPSIICEQSRVQLDAVGLTPPDIVLMTQIIGFVGYQARVIASVQALMGQPVRWIPGMPVQEDAPAELFIPNAVGWKAGISGIQDENGHNDGLTRLLAWDKALVTLLDQLAHALTCDEEQATFIALVNARINGSLDCLQRQDCPSALIKAAREGEQSLKQWCQDKPSLSQLLGAILILTRSPDRFGTPQLSPLFEQGLSADELLSLLALSGFNGWYNRLKIGLGEASPVT